MNMLSTLMIGSLAVPLLALSAAVPPSSNSILDARRIPLTHTPHAKRVGPDGTVRGWAPREKAKTESKYATRLAPNSATKRDGMATLQDYYIDAAYSASVSIGTPAQEFYLLLDTGSADLFIVGSSCDSSCSGLTTWDPTSSSTYTNESTAFEITYGSGDASGYLVSDTVSLAGISETSQTLAVVTEISSGLLSSPLSGIMGMGFEALSSSNSVPWWQAESSTWTSKVFAFELARYRNIATATDFETQGGYIDLGALNASHYSGDVNYITCSAQTYWEIPVSGLSVEGTSIDISISSTSSSSSKSSSSSSTPQAAIDTGTTMISVTTTVAAAVYAAISGSSAMTESGYEGYYEYPCSSSVNISLTFGDITYTIDPDDFNIGALDSQGTSCLGGIYGSDLDSTVDWIIGDTFLKNVYSVYSYSGTTTGSQVGFASLADGSTVSTGSASTTNSSTSSSSSNSSSSSTSGASSLIRSKTCIAGLLIIVLTAGTIILI
uniref:Aspartic peptidase n=1 Tax=Phaffia rhodozyma TaxID=264483 RepID=A0A1I9Q711_PHARH|nr:aspartic peptidase [Phaffia rhodozyma]